IWIGRTIGEKSPVGEECLGEAGALNGFEETRWDNFVGVDIPAIQGYHQTSMCDKWFQNLTPSLQSQCANIYKMASDSRGGSHCRTDEMGTPTTSLTALKIAITS